MNDAGHPTALELLVGFEMGLYSRDDLSTWVYVEVERLDALPDPLLELTALRGKHDVDIGNLLRQLAPVTTVDARARTEMGALRELVRSGRVPPRRAVYSASRIAQEISWGDYCTAVGLEDQFELAEAGTYGTVADAEREFLAFLDRFVSESNPAR